MVKIMGTVVGLSITHRTIPAVLCQCIVHRNLATDSSHATQKQRIIHPYRKIHPWKSPENFSEFLLNNVIYNKDGLVAINKPYGISTKSVFINEEPENENRNSYVRKNTEVANSVNYTISECLPNIASKLGYKNLQITKSPERYMSGVLLLAANSEIHEAVLKSYARAITKKILNTTYWIVTTKLVRQTDARQKVAITFEYNKDRSEKAAVIVKKWANAAVKRGEVKELHTEYRVLSNSTKNLSSLVEVKLSTRKWNALRLFASTMLYSPILGDNVYGSRIQNTMGVWLCTSPFSDAATMPPKLNEDLLYLLKLTKSKQDLIPAHIHLRSIELPHFLKNKEDLTITAPLIFPFTWTCEQLEFKNIFNLDENLDQREITAVASS